MSYGLLQPTRNFFSWILTSKVFMDQGKMKVLSLLYKFENNQWWFW